ncbi:MAG: HD domain-containing protein [Armatimonadetes bacterium]|nr:HD domain-containing protein [Armatimonadota bacterium]
MSTRLASLMAAERLGLKIRGTLVGAAVFLLWEIISEPVVAITLGAFAASVLVAYRLCADPKVYERFGRRYSEGMRFVDGFVVVGLGFSAFGQVGNLWPLGIPILISQGIITRSRERVYLLAVSMLATHVMAWFSWKVGLSSIVLFSDVAVSAGVLMLGAVSAIVLASFTSRDERLASRDQRLGTVFECGRALASTSDLRETMLHTLRSAVAETGASCGYILLREEDSEDWLRTEVAFAGDGEFEFPERIEVGSGMSGYVGKMGEPIMVSNSGREHYEFDGVTAGVYAAVSVPLVARQYAASGQSATGTILGVLTLLSLTPGHAFELDDVELLQTVSALLAVAVANARLDVKQRAAFLSTLESFAKSLEARDEYTRGHSQRVCEISMMIGEHLDLSVDVLEEVRVGTLLHDIGKIGVPDAILNKPGALTEEEFEIMKTHSLIGYEICRPLNLTDGVLLLIRNHHERLDGSGYPDGLKGGELPLSLRIVCVADAFDAMSSRRPYRDVMTRTSIIGELSQHAGTQFDPVVVESLKELLASDRLAALYEAIWGAVDQEAA